MFKMSITEQTTSSTYLDIYLFYVYGHRRSSGNDVRRATTRTLNLPNQGGAAIGCQESRDKNNKHCWGAFGSRKQFVDMHNR